MREARLVPRKAQPYLTVPAGAHDAGLAPVRREALEVLAAGYRSTPRTLLAVLATLVGAAGVTTLAVLPWHGATGAQTAALAALGMVLLVGGIWFAAGVLRSGRRITAAAAAWLRVPVPGARPDDAAVLLGVLRWRAVLGGVAAAAAVALTVTLAYVLSRTGVLGAAQLGSTAVPAVSEATRALVVAALAGTALTTAAAAVGTFAGVRRLTEAAWDRPAVVPAAPPTSQQAAPSVPAALQRGGPPAPPSPLGPPTVAIDLRALSALAAAAPAPASARPAGAGTAAWPAVEVVLPDGRVLRPGTTLLGRRPLARPEDVVDDVAVLTDQTVTKTHAAITVDDDGVRVVDRASTNGTLLEAPDGSLARCRPWQVTTVRAPAIIHLGRTRLHVRAAAARRPLEVA